MTYDDNVEILTGKKGRTKMKKFSVFPSEQ